MATAVAAALAPQWVHAEVGSGPPVWIARGRRSNAYLFGEMPVKADTAWRTPKVLEAFAKAKTLWLENPVFRPEEGQALARRRASQVRMTTAKFLPAGDLKRLHQLLAASGAPAAALDDTAADDAYQALTALGDSISGADFSKLPERFFRGRALAANLPIKTEWANLEEVATFIPDAPDPIRLEMIRLGMDDLEAARDLGKRLAAWLDNDVGYFDSLGVAIDARYPAMTTKMDRVRNTRWAERLAAALDRDGDSFVCVGIRHLSGPTSMQAILRKMGVEVRLFTV